MYANDQTHDGDVDTQQFPYGTYGNNPAVSSSNMNTTTTTTTTATTNKTNDGKKDNRNKKKNGPTSGLSTNDFTIRRNLPDGSIYHVFRNRKGFVLGGLSLENFSSVSMTKVKEMPDITGAVTGAPHYDVNVYVSGTEGDFKAPIKFEFKTREEACYVTKDLMLAARAYEETKRRRQPTFPSKNVDGTYRYFM